MNLFKVFCLLFSLSNFQFKKIMFKSTSIFLFFLFCFFQNSFAKNRNPFNKLSYDSVISYDFKGNGDNSIIKNGSLNKRLIVKSITLSKKQIKSITKTIGNKSSYGGSTMSCFDPHLGIVYYKNGLIVAHINICFECNYLTTYPTLPNNLFMFKEKEETDLVYLEGFSEKGKNELMKICNELNFSHCKGSN